MKEIASGLDVLLERYRAYFDHIEAQTYTPALIPGRMYTTYREEARRKLVKYFMRNGMPDECRKTLERKRTTH